LAAPVRQRGLDVQQAAPQPRSQTIRVYFVKGERFAPVERRVAPKGRESVAARAVEWLLAGPSDTERRRGTETTIPTGTSLGTLAVADGTATIELNARPSAPSAADVSLRPARAAQIVYTLTALPDVERVLINVNGTKRATFVGSDLLVRGPLDQHDLSRPIRLTQHPRVPVGPAPVDVAGVQKRLAALSYFPPNAVTGAWDYRTKQAVLAFQSRHGLARDGIVGPQTIAALEVAARPQPRSRDDGRRIEVDRAKGVVLLIDGPDVIRTVHASTGAPAYETPAGSYSVFRKETNSWSVPYQVWLPYASYFNGGIAFHASDEVPTRPVSHGCVRLSAPEAPFVYEFAAVGTPVLVY
jgi:peptidoglycan hydrolase-like protein with peptidoglycan-binding domain